ncbi:hypothetical protein [Acidiferrimicrobium sp. IK]|uniref:hypothetical protein n=1 Tax=Acidiferrimicrobium sp. IK TaxID=2871700 RepID=UPI0021CAFCC6|nr:hypothetical protein [Acidiferrimicrobium sp. IK]
MTPDVMEAPPATDRPSIGCQALDDRPLTTAVWLPAVVAAHAQRDPSRTAIEVAGRPTSFATLHRRSRKLASSLGGLAAPGAMVDIVCCAEHLDELLVAYLACRTAGLRPCVHMPSELPADRGHGAVGAVACESGTAAWQAAGLRGWLVGDGLGARWWRLLELIHPPLELDRSHAIADEVDLIRGPGTVVGPGDIRTSLGALAAGVVQRLG